MPSFKPSTKLIPAIFAWSLLIVCSAIFFGCASEFLAGHSPIIPIYQGILTLFVVSNFVLATIKDPGIYPRAHDDESKADESRAPLYRNADINGVTIRLKWCQTCRFYRPPRCSHCSVCDHCIEVFDHHCPWLNNCIGRRNYRYFFQLLLSLMLDMCSMFAFCLFFVVSHSDALATAQNILLIVVMIIIGLLFLPIAALTLFHVFLVSKGKTTNEQTTGKLKGIDNPYSNGCLGNWMMTLYGPLWPKLTNRNSKSSAVDLDNLRLVYRMSGNVNRVYMESINGLPRNGSHSNRVLGSLSLVSEKDLNHVHSVSKHVSSDWDIPLGASAHSLSGQPSVGLGMIGLTNRTFSSSSFPLVQPLSGSTHSLLDQVHQRGYGQYNGAVVQPNHGKRNPAKRKTTSSAGSLSGMAEIGQGMELFGISQKPFDSSLSSHSRPHSEISSAPKPKRTRTSSGKTRQALSLHDSLPLAADQKYPKTVGLVSLDNVNLRPFDKPQVSVTGSAGQGALGGTNWGSASTSQPRQSNTAATGVVPPQRHKSSGSRTRHLREPELSAGKDKVNKDFVKVSKEVEPTKQLSPMKHHRQQTMKPVPVLMTVPNVPGSVRRPMSFVKALEVSDQLAVVEQRHGRDMVRPSDLSPQPEEEFQSILEISV